MATSNTPDQLSDIQRTILRLARAQGFVNVGTDYIAEVLSLQCQRLITSSPIIDAPEGHSYMVVNPVKEELINGK